MHKRYFSTFQIIQLALLAALAVVAQLTVRFPAVGLPGHAALFDTAILVLASGLVPKFGSATLAGAICGVLSAFLGLGNLGPLNSLFTFLLMGIGVDAVALLAPKREHLATMIVAGIVGSFGRMAARWAWGVLAGMPMGFVALGMIRSLLGYLIFGTLGGLLAGLTIAALRRAGYFAYVLEKR